MYVLKKTNKQRNTNIIVNALGCNKPTIHTINMKKNSRAKFHSRMLQSSRVHTTLFLIHYSERVAAELIMTELQYQRHSVELPPATGKKTKAFTLASQSYVTYY